MKKKLLAAALALCMVFGSAAALPEGVFSESASITASAASTATSGKCGENVRWSLKNGVLTISGSGAMYDYSHSGSPLEHRSDITSVVIKSGVTSISGRMFFGCEKIKSISLSNSITSIGESAFMKCRGLTSVTIPKSVKSIGDDAFCCCSSLKNINIPTSVKSIGGMAFDSTKWLKNQREKNNFVVVNGILIDAAKCTGKVIIPNTVKVIGEDAFFWTRKITSIKIPNSVKRFEEGAFYQCDSLKTINIPESVTSIGRRAFEWCTKLTSVTIPKSVTKIGKKAFGYGMYGEKIEDFVIKGYKGTAAEKYAKDNGFKFVALSTPAQQPTTIRFAGANRYDTAALISKASHKTKSDTVIIADAMTFQDALIAVPLAKAYNAPLLLANPNIVTKQTEAELARLKAKKVIIVNTSNALKKGTLDALKKKYTTQIINGRNCFETSKRVAEELQKKTKKAPTDVFFTTNKAFADALSISPVAALKGAPILYVDPSKKTLDSNILAYLNKVKGSIKNVYIVGGTVAVPKAIENSIKKALPKKNVKRFDGAQRYETCVMINKYFAKDLSSKTVCIAKGLDFPDALAGGVFAANQKAPLLLADSALRDTHKSFLKDKKPNKLYIFGGKVAVPDKLAKEVAKMSV